MSLKSSLLSKYGIENYSSPKIDLPDTNNQTKSGSNPDMSSIVEIVECLQQRKMKPDVEKISTYVEKSFPNVYKNDPEIVEKLVEDCLARGMIVSVNNQNVISFRTPSKIGRMLRITKILLYEGEVPESVIHEIVQSIGEIEIAAIDSTDEEPRGSGVTIFKLAKHLHSSLRFLNYSEEILEKKVFVEALAKGINNK